MTTPPPRTPEESPAGGLEPTGDVEPAGGGEPSGRGMRLLDDRRVVIALGAVVALLGVALAFLIGSAIGARGEAGSAPAPSPAATTPTPTPTPSPTPTVIAAPAGPVAPGVREWTELGGRECIEPYTSPWAEEFTVVPCTDPHRAQLVARASFSDDPLAPYPGEAALTSQLGLLCSAPAVIDYGRAGAYSDVQLQAAYPPDEASWARGERSYYCFASLAGGGVLTDTIAVG